MNSPETGSRTCGQAKSVLHAGIHSRLNGSMEDADEEHADMIAKTAVQKHYFKSCQTAPNIVVLCI